MYIKLWLEGFYYDNTYIDIYFPQFETFLYTNIKLSYNYPLMLINHNLMLSFS